MSRKNTIYCALIYICIQYTAHTLCSLRVPDLYGGHILAYNVCERRQYSLINPMKPRPYQIARVHEVLKEISPGSLYPFPDCDKVLFCVKLFYHRCPEFILNMTGQQKGHAFLYFGQHFFSCPRCFHVTGRGILDVHRHIIDQAIAGKLFEPGWETSVGIEFYQKTEGFDFRNKPPDFLLYERFPTRYANAVQQPFTPGQKIKKILNL